MKPPNTEDFRTCLKTELAKATERGDTHLVVRAGDLHNLVGGYSGTSSHRMRACCRVMWNEKRDDDKVLTSPRLGQGANLEIRYRLPR